MKYILTLEELLAKQQDWLENRQAHDSVLVSRLYNVNSTCDQTDFSTLSPHKVVMRDIKEALDREMNDSISLRLHSPQIDL